VKQIIKISSDMIQLNQLLKWIGVLETGGQIGFFLERRAILLNGVVVQEKRKKIYPGDTVIINNDEYIVMCDEEIKNEC
jgi:ribosome-associated protein